MIQGQRSFSLECKSERMPAPVLTAVQAAGRIDGVLFELALRQTYRNTGAKNLEVVYTFPLPDESVLLGFAAELNGARRVGTITAKHQAEREYEQALSEGDAPVMLEALGSGMYTANVGNLKPGDEMVLEVRFAQCLRFEQGRLRLAIPSTIAPRYGSAASAGLQPQQEPTASLTAEYPLTLSLMVAGSLAGAALDCPTHRFTIQPAEDGLRFDLTEGAWLDRDVVIVLNAGEPSASALTEARDSISETAPVVAMAAFQPAAAAPRESIALKLLVDCSGSMGGDSIKSARAALAGVLQGMGEADQVSLTCFGSTFEHRLKPTVCAPKALTQLGSLIERINADMGGTEMHDALASVFKLPAARGTSNADVLLLTDGEIWAVEETIEAAKKSGHRIFVIGVGSSPAQSVIRSLAEATGGACEFATPGEALEAAASRMLVRMRQQVWRDIRIDWGSQTQWQTAVSLNVFGGDTVIAFGGMSTRTTGAAVRLLGTNEHGEQLTLASCEANAPSPGDTLARMAAAMRIKTEAEGESLRLALAYQLMGTQTNCILVHQRAEADKPAEEAELHRVQAMLAAGWGATGSVELCHQAMHMMPPPHSMSMSMSRLATSAEDFRSMNQPSVWRTRSASASVSDMAAAMDEIQIPEYLKKSASQQPKDTPKRKPVPSATASTDPSPAKPVRKSPPVAHGTPAPLRLMAQELAEYLAGGASMDDLDARATSFVLHPDVRSALDEITALGLTASQAWALLASWTSLRPEAMLGADYEDVLKACAESIPGGLRGPCLAVLNRILGGYGVDKWMSARERRLSLALSRA